MNIGAMLERVAYQRSGPTPGFSVRMMQVVDGGYMVEGGVHHLVTRGPRKGQKSWNGARIQRFFISHEQLLRAALAYESETGNCAECEGLGEVFVKWSRETGTTMRPCGKCSATGKQVAA